MKIVFMGTPQAAVPSLARILRDGHEVVAVWTQPDRPAGRGRKLTPSPVKEFAIAEGLTVRQPSKLKNRESIDLFRSHDADAAVVVAYGRILTRSYLKAYPGGCINVHFSLLPKYRGAAPVNWAIVRGEERTGVTTMQMDRGLDTGDILLQSETQIGPAETSIELMDRLSVLGADLIGRTLASLGEIEPVAQNDDEATYAPLMSKEDGRIDWELTAVEIRNRVRGFQPFPRSYSEYRGQTVTFWKADAIEVDSAAAEDLRPGEIVEASGDELLIACGGATALRVHELQIEGKRRMETRDFLNGVGLETGEVLGGNG